MKIVENDVPKAVSLSDAKPGKVYKHNSRKRGGIAGLGRLFVEGCKVS